ncbi:LLM class flavin-dependent oxidoreductase [Zavarzinia sp. CC-PAN008]|uniref:LLM class flavin-dependent oxidoreductase n=1 Tax=Zavarzinia sp. CC-PAN008 TaxID=3243332 RepID=UPI003F7489A3
MSSREMHLIAFLITGPTCHHHGAWRHPEAENRFLDPVWWETLAQTLEKGKFDAFFFADILSIPNRTLIERGGQIALLDPVPLIANMARATRHLGLGVTISTSFVPPYSLARQLATLDILSGGRVAWNIVTSASTREAENMGFDQLPAKNARYDRADEVVEACIQMWEGWDHDAMVMDKESGIFADMSKIRNVNYEGQWIKTKGIPTTPRSPQGKPILMQAGSSERGRQFAARWAELVFTLMHSIPDMQEFYQDLKGRMADLGRAPEECAILTSVDPIIGETEEIAREKQAYVNSLVDEEVGIALISAHTGIDLSGFARDKPLALHELDAGSRGSMDVIMQGVSKENLTLGEAAKRFATSELCPQVVGTPEQVADQLQEMFEAKGCDGFILTPTLMPGMFEQFARSVVPILQKRGLFRTEYPGTTLRETLLGRSLKPGAPEFARAGFRPRVVGGRS